MHRLEIERLAGRFAIERQTGRAVACRRAERIFADASLHGAKARRIITQFCGKAARPQFHGAWHRLLHVGVARQRQIALARSEPCQRSGDRLGRFGQLQRCVAHVEAQCGQHLIVARTAKVHTPARGADERRESLLQRRLPVFIGQLDTPCALRMRRGERLEALLDSFAVGG